VYADARSSGQCTASNRQNITPRPPLSWSHHPSLHTSQQSYPSHPQHDRPLHPLPLPHHELPARTLARRPCPPAKSRKAGAENVSLRQRSSPDAVEVRKPADSALPKNFDKPMTCFFWHQFGRCNKRDVDCAYAHWDTGFMAGAPINLPGCMSPSPFFHSNPDVFPLLMIDFSNRERSRKERRETHRKRGPSASGYPSQGRNAQQTRGRD
jgi:hypothetical protein